MTAQVEFREIRKVFDRQPVLCDINFSVAAGEFVVLLGPSGCGKSTLLRLTAGLEQITQGAIILAGRVINDVPPAERDISMVFQSYALYPLMTVRDNLAFNQKIRKVPPAEIERRVKKTADTLGLEDFLERRPAQLSGGQRQRVAMGRAMMRDPKLFLFDEPLSNLDARLRAHMRAEIKSLQRQLGTTTIYVTHDQIEAMTMADKIIIIQDGRIAQIGAPFEIYNQPCTADVARFVGSPEINFLTAWLDETHCRIGDTLLPLHLRNTQPAEKCLLGIRPHDITLCDTEAAESVAGTVHLVEPTGGFDIVHVRTNAGDTVVVQMPAGSGCVSGESCGLKIRMEKTHFFSPKSGLRLQLAAPFNNL